MAAVAADYDFSRSAHAHQHSSPDTASPMYPERLIRPLPKRRLRSRLSEEEANSIEFPPARPTVSPLFNLPHVERSSGLAGRAPRGDVDEHKCQCGADHGVEYDGGYVDDVDGTHERGGRRGDVDDHGAWEQQHVAYGKPPPPGSTTSSADGYDSFENTNNKKKRKIPLSGGNHHHSSLSAEMVNMTISNPAGEAAQRDDTGTGGNGGHYYPQGSSQPHSSSGTGIAGAGRGRYGRPRHSLERRPLGASTNGLNAFSGAGNAKVPPSDGIIAAAMADAAVQGHMSPPPEGDENISLLQHQAAKSVTPQSSQFTFSMDSESGKALYGAGHPNPNLLSGSGRVPPGYNVPHSKMRGGMIPPGQVPNAPLPQHGQRPPQPQQGQPPMGDPNAAPPRRRKPLSKLYQLAARQRRLQQEYGNYHHPPKNSEDIWICEFCEYEAIFGIEPKALVWQYEEKDRRERKRIAEKRRLLEKAKMKGRKNRKGGKKSKAGANTGAAGNQQRGAEQYDQHVDSLTGQPLDQEGDEFYDDDYDDEPIAGAPPPPTPTPELLDQPGMIGGPGGGGDGGGGGGHTAMHEQHQARPPPTQGKTRKA